MKLGYYERGAEGEVDTQMKYGRENESIPVRGTHKASGHLTVWRDKEAEIRKDDMKYPTDSHLGTASNSRD